MHECFMETFSDEIRVYHDIQDPEVRHDAMVRVAHATQGVRILRLLWMFACLSFASCGLAWTVRPHRW